jgi:secreted PhoX family phosphatase
VNNEDRTEIEDYVTSSGILNNCAGGATPWGTWLTWEEDRNINYGYVFEVDPNDPENELSGTPIRDMSFISHEAVDGDTVNRVMGMTPDGQVYAFASKRTSDGEFWGPTFAPDGKTFLVSTSRTPASPSPSGVRSKDVFALPDM